MRVMTRNCLSHLVIMYSFLAFARLSLIKDEVIKAYAVKADGTMTEFDVKLGDLTDAERDIIMAGCLINYYRG